MTALDRRRFLAVGAALGLPALLTEQVWADAAGTADTADAAVLLKLTAEQVAGAESVMGLPLTEAERTMVLPSLEQALTTFGAIRQVPLPNDVVPAVAFTPEVPGVLAEPLPTRGVKLPAVNPAAPTTDADWGFATVAELGALLRAKRVTVRQLTERTLARLEAADRDLLCVTALLRERALAQADLLDTEARAGTWRGPLHGIPWGAKDLLSVPGAPTTWGSPLYKDRVLSETATVVERLDAAGAVLVAKLTLGEFAMGDVWYGGRTRNPWNLDQGSSGSSAGSASAVSAGLLPFAIGSETLGSIVSPCTRCGVSGLRPTFGRVSRHGAMALSWTMDKLGPIARTAEDLALVFDTIHGADPRDPTARTVAFGYDATRPLASIRIGIHAALAEGGANAAGPIKPVLEALRARGATFTTVAWPEDLPAAPLNLIIGVEGAAAFDAITRDNLDDRMVQQTANAWPNTFRAARFVPAVEYLQANRVRTLLMQRLDAMFRTVDVVITPPYAGNVLVSTNLSGHPAVVVPVGFGTNDAPQTMTVIGGLWKEELALRVAAEWQAASAVHRRRPPRFA
ncbi:MAG TPA: amidase [Gemmatimonadales bacterium]|nr:amidase [Gemmatimonadales bacterium]